MANLRIIAVIAAALVGLGLVVAWLTAQATPPKPTIVEAKGEQCVEDTDFMRKNHMKVLDHHRDRVVIDGVRTKKHSLKECINCHASPETGSVAKSKDDFCISCHAYSAVKIDCFDCHSTRPQGPMAMHPMNADTAHYRHRMAAGTQKTIGAEEMAGVAQ